MRSGSINVLVTSAGTASAVSVIKALKDQDQLSIQIHAVDADPLAAGLYLADSYDLVPEAKSEHYISELIRICKEREISLLIPIYSKEIGIISTNSDRLSEEGIRTFLPEPSVISLCNNKVLMDQFCREHSIPVPKLFGTDELIRNESSLYPVFAKPLEGSSSNGTQKITNHESFLDYYQSHPNHFYQEFIEGTEVTVDVLCDPTFRPLVVSPRTRIATKSGQAVKAQTIRDQRLTELTTRICSLLKFTGPCNLQFFVTEKQVWFIELNPRFAAGGLMLTIAAGANIPLLIVKLIEGKSIMPQETIAREGLYMTRYWEEVILDANFKKV